MGLSEFAIARRVMRRYLLEDVGVKMSYVTDMVMLLHDKHGISEIATCEMAAKDVLNLLFDLDKGIES